MSAILLPQPRERGRAVVQPPQPLRHADVRHVGGTRGVRFLLFEVGRDRSRVVAAEQYHARAVRAANVGEAGNGVS